MGTNNAINASSSTPVDASTGGSGASTLTGVLTGNGTSAFTANAVTQYGVVLGGASNAVASTAVGSAGQVLQSSGAGVNPAYSTATYPLTTSVSQLLYSSSANVVAGLSTANNGVLVTSAGGVPSISSTLPSAVQANITATNTGGSVTNVNLVNTGATAIFTTPAGVTFIPSSVSVVITTSTAFAVAASISVGTNGAAYDDILPITVLSGLSVVGAVLNIPIVALSVVVPATTQVFIKVTTGAVADALKATVKVNGFYY